jgi:hypothetical protein
LATGRPKEPQPPGRRDNALVSTRLVTLSRAMRR